MSEQIECFWHGPEPDRPGDYKACGECWHVWRTEADFRADVERLYTDLNERWASEGWHGEPPPLDQVYSCPLCAHDF